MSAPEVAQIDLAYHDVHRGHGLYYQLQRSGTAERTARDIDIFEAKTLPPPQDRYRQVALSRSCTARQVPDPAAQPG